MIRNYALIIASHHALKHKNLGYNSSIFQFLWHFSLRQWHLHNCQGFLLSKECHVRRWSTKTNFEGETWYRISCGIGKSYAVVEVHLHGRKSPLFCKKVHTQKCVCDTTFSITRQCAKKRPKRKGEGMALSAHMPQNVVSIHWQKMVVAYRLLLHAFSSNIYQFILFETTLSSYVSFSWQSGFFSMHTRNHPTLKSDNFVA